MNVADSFPKVADCTDYEFRFITDVTPSMCGEIREMMGFAFDWSQDASADGDRVDEVRWSERFWKLNAITQEAAMVVLLAPPWTNKWSVVDSLVLGDDGVCRP